MRRKHLTRLNPLHLDQMAINTSKSYTKFVENNFQVVNFKALCWESVEKSAPLIILPHKKQSHKIGCVVALRTRVMGNSKLIFF